MKSKCFLLNSVNVVKVTLERCPLFNNILIIYDHRNVPNGWLPILIVVMVHGDIWAQACCYSTGEKKRRPFYIPVTWSALFVPWSTLFVWPFYISLSISTTVLSKKCARNSEVVVFSRWSLNEVLLYIKTRREKWKSLFLVVRMVFHMWHIFYSVIYVR